MSFKKNTIRSIFQLGGFTYAGEVLSFLASIVLARLLLPEEYGMVAMIMVLTSFALILSDAGMASDIVRSNYGYTYHRALSNLSLYIGIGLCTLVMALAYPLALFYENMDLVLPTMLVSTQFIFKAIAIVQYAVLIKRQEFILLGQIELSATIMSLVLMILMAYLGFSYWSLIVPVIIADIYKFFFYLYFTRIKIRILPLPYTIVAFRHAKTIMGSILGTRIISYWARNLDNILIGKQFGEAPLGIYNRGYRFLDLTRKLFEGLFGTVLFPSLQKLREENGDVHKEYLFFVGVICLLSFPIGAVLILFPDLLVRILWGPSWIEVARFLPYFGLIILSQMNISNSETIYKIFRKDLLLFQMGIFYALVMVGSIVAGSFYSPMMIVQLLSLAHILVIVPTTLYFAFAQKLKFGYKRISSIFLPRVILLTCIFLSEYFGLPVLTVLLATLYLLHLLFILRNDLNSLKDLLMARIKKNS